MMAIIQMNRASFAGTIGGVVLLLLMTTPAFWQLAKKIYILKYRQKKPDGVYEDKDGVATEASEAAYSATLPLCAVCASSVLGFAVSTTFAVLVTLDITRDGMLIENWLVVAGWVGLNL